MRPFSEIDVGATATVTVGAVSSSVIVPMPVPAVLDTIALLGSLRATATVSFASSSVSPVTDTAMVLLVSLATNVSVPAGSAV